MRTQDRWHSRERALCLRCRPGRSLTHGSHYWTYGPTPIHRACASLRVECAMRRRKALWSTCASAPAQWACRRRWPMQMPEPSATADMNAAGIADGVDVDVQHASGSFHLDFLDGFTSSYSNVTNIVARLGSGDRPERGRVGHRRRDTSASPTARLPQGYGRIGTHDDRLGQSCPTARVASRARTAGSARMSMCTSALP